MTIFASGTTHAPNPMKIIHTSDWHLGQIFNEYDRVPEHMAFFRELRAAVEREKPDALLVCGDVYHTSTPSSAIQRLYTDTILQMKKACPGMTVVVTAGNHDSPSRLEIDRNLWDCLNVKVIGSVCKHDGVPDIDRHIIRIPSDDGPAAGYVVALPHIYRQNYPTGVPEDKRAADAAGNDVQDNEYSRQKAFYKSLLDRILQLNTNRLPVVVTAHLAVTGCDISGHEEPIGGMEYTSLDTFPEGYDYLALGHIHHPQTLRRSGARSANPEEEEVYISPVARYSGSPIPVNFDENYRHSISVVEIVGPEGNSGRKTVKIRQVEIPQTIPVVTIPDRPVPFAEALEELENFPDDREAYIRLNVLIKDYLPQNATAQAISASESKACRYCSMKVTKAFDSCKDSDQPLTIEEIRTGNPVDIACLYYRRKFGTGIDRELKSMLEEVVREETGKKE